jgi:predicted cupin superfamily sugar epimerase
MAPSSTSAGDAWRRRIKSANPTASYEANGFAATARVYRGLAMAAWSINEYALALVHALGLAPHPEGGFYREMFRASQVVQTPRGPRAASTAIYFLLPAGTFSALHRVASDEVWHHYDGDPLELHTIAESGEHTATVLGKGIQQGDRPQHVVRAGVWQAAVPRGARFALCGCTVAPGFDFVDFEMPRRDELTMRFPHLTTLVQQLTRA